MPSQPRSRSENDVEGARPPEDVGGGPPPAPRPRSRRLDTAIIVALIGLVGTLGAALIAALASRSDPGPTPTSTLSFTATLPFTSTATELPTLTATLPPAAPSLTPVTPSSTPSLTATVTAVPPVRLGEDWLKGCISLFWKPLPAEMTAVDRGDGCWSEPLHFFSAENGDLDFLAQRRIAGVEVYGLFAPLPEQGTVSVRIRLRELNNTDIWMGVFAEDSLNSDGLLMVIPSGNVKKRVFVQKDPRTYETIGSGSTALLEQGNGFWITFTFRPNSVRSTINPSVLTTSPVPIPSPKKWLFLGYRGAGNYRVDGTFLSFELK